MSDPHITPGEQRALPEPFGFQAAICRHMGSDLCADLLERCVGDDAVAAIIDDWPGDTLRDFVPLRLLGGVHQLVLTGAAPALAAHYPSTGGVPRFPGAWSAFRATLVEHRHFLRDFLTTTPQTNEIARSAALATGFHAVSDAFGLPLRLRELGASAGLNLLFDRYAFDFGGTGWNEGSGGPLLRPEWRGAAPRLSNSLVVSSRAGCDLFPIDLSDPRACSRLQAYVWPDQPKRLERLRRAIELAQADLPRLDRSGAATWIEKELAVLPEHSATVVYHSSFWIYVSEQERDQIAASIEHAGARATPERAVAWLRLEDVDAHFELRLQCWPGGSDHLLAESDAHGRVIHWQSDNSTGST